MSAHDTRSSGASKPIHVNFNGPSPKFSKGCVGLRAAHPDTPSLSGQVLGREKAQETQMRNLNVQIPLHQLGELRNRTRSIAQDRHQEVQPLWREKPARILDRLEIEP